MRPRDQHKQAALIEATLHQVTEHGFGATTVARIARQADISPGTVYIYYRDKDTLLEAAFLHASDQLIDTVLAAFAPRAGLRESLGTVWRALFALALKQPRLFRFHEQFTHSSRMHPALQERNEARLMPLLEALEQGQRSGVIKPVGLELIEAFLFRPIHSLIHGHSCRPFTPTPEAIDSAFAMAWDAIALPPASPLAQSDS
ncbi:TetR/AcrR family transcriptional regulator [Onishia niordana]|uniref:TetR/AcrR family transcriptional regulator n=1 Tax=Onishia niordana TaxID=2508711 RepID=UPI0010A06198|nr:TetR/AcrR family transcriptional regulator [Halomonas niordiana]